MRCRWMTLWGHVSGAVSINEAVTFGDLPKDPRTTLYPGPPAPTPESHQRSCDRGSRRLRTTGATQARSASYAVKSPTVRVNQALVASEFRVSLAWAYSEH